MRIYLVQPADKGDYIFQISEGKKTLLTSSDYYSRKESLVQLKTVLTTLRDDEQISIQAGNNNQFYFEVADCSQSPSYEDIEQASDVLASLKEFAQTGSKFTAIAEKTSKKAVSKKQLGLRAELYQFDKKSTSGKIGFELLVDKNTQNNYFHFNDANGKAMLFSRAYDGKNNRKKAIRNLIKNVGNPDRIEVIHLAGSYLFIVKNAKGFEVARSRKFASEDKLTTALDLLKKEAGNFKKDFKQAKKKKKKKRKAKEKYHLKQKAPLGLIGFEGFKSRKNKLHYFHFHDTPSETLLVSEPYESRSKRDESISYILKNGGKDKVYRTWKKGKDQYYFSILGKDEKSFARSRYFPSKKEMLAGLVDLQSKISDYEKEVNFAPVTNQKEFTFELTDKETTLPIIPVVPAVAGAVISVIPDSMVEKPTMKTKIEKKSIKETETDWLTAESAETAISEEVLDDFFEDDDLETEGFFIEAEPVAESIAPPTTIRPPAPERVYETTKKVPPKPIIEDKPSSGFPWKWLLLGLGAIALLGLLRFCTMEKAISKVAPPPKEVIVPPVIETEVKPVTMGPTAADLNFTPTTAEGKMADFLSAPKASLPKTFLLESVHFPFNSAELTPTSFEQLDHVAEVLSKYPNAKIEVNGHTDSRGNDDLNLTLSQNRATTVQTYLIGKGIAADRIIKAIGFGETKPVDSNDTEEGRLNNRRSEVVVVER